MTILTKWKFQTRNKIETSKIEDQIKLFVDYKDKDDDDDKISTMAKQLLASWSELSLGFRIPKAQRVSFFNPFFKKFFFSISQSFPLILIIF